MVTTFSTPCGRNDSAIAQISFIDADEIKIHKVCINVNHRSRDVTQRVESNPHYVKLTLLAIHDYIEFQEEELRNRQEFLLNHFT